MQNIERVIRKVNGTMSIEGMPLTSNDKNRIRSCASERALVKKEVEKLVKKHTRNYVR